MRQEAIYRALNGEPPKRIAASMNISHAAVTQWVARARSQGVPIPDFRSIDKEERTHIKMVRINTELAMALEEERKNRGYTSVARFLHEVLGIMVEEPNLFDAVLDKD